METLSERLRGHAPALEDMRQQEVAKDLLLAADRIEQLEADNATSKKFWDGMWAKLETGN
jgi:hypothetical protein